ncbi:unnamed protein product [Sphagnum troendelagicum]|uniref:Oxidation resistance protein 1 n=1 Tax=Sphagnum troendelagicum TaxID=128251 RepID=A0ABP0TJE3_9BRYO
MGLLAKPLGWVDSVGNKVGCLLADKTPSFRSHEHAPLLTQDPDEEERSNELENCSNEDLDFEGPDTSSLSAFLWNLLSCSESDIRGAEEAVSSSADHVEVKGGSFHVPASSASNPAGQVQGLLKVEACGAENVAEDTKLGGRPTGDSEDEADWQLVDKHDLFHSRMIGSVSEQAMVSMGHDDLPATSDKSSLMSESLRGFLHSALPTLAKGRQWVLLYSTQKHGMSLLTLYRRSAMLPGPCLLVAGDTDGVVFGGLMNAPLQPTPTKKYQGTSESFVFTNIADPPYIFHPTGLNRYFVLCTSESLAFGGGGHFALHIDAELLNGSSGACETYGNCSLSQREDFTLKDVELWGFVHTSRYTPSYAIFKEPEEVPSFRSW